MTSFPDAVSEDRDGTIIALDVTAGAKKDSFPAGYNEWRKAIVCRVSAPALEGRANRAVIALVAGTLGVAASSVTIRSGATSSQKKVLVLNLSRDDVLGRLRKE